MFSMKMGLPPRFAGVTLLALGNGAADVSATISAIAQNPQEGYQMSLGALTGAGMFVGTAVAGIVIVIADGVKCRGALVRDLLMFVITLGVVYGYFERGEIGPGAIQCFFWLYLSFVLVVLLADIYHRAVVLPRIRKEESEARLRLSAVNVGFGDMGDGIGTTIEEGEESSTGTSVRTGGLSPPGEVELASARTTSTDVFHTPLNSRLEEEGYSSGDDGPTSPLRRPGLALANAAPPLKPRGVFRRGVDRVMVAMSNYGPDEGKAGVNQSFYGWGGGLEVNSERNDEQVKFHGAHGILTNRGSVEEQDEEPNEPAFAPTSSYRALMEGMDNMCTIEGSLSSGMGTSWYRAWLTAKEDFGNHFSDYNRDFYARLDCPS